jgi:glycosyltransferase involved in cell wall biosynthesis
VRGGDPELAVVVLSHREPPEMVLAAVDSILAQGGPVELIVSHSGREDVPAALARQRPQVTVAASRRRRSVGAARNVGVSRTRAPYVAFLAADCLARPGWVAGRLTRHRRGARVVASCVLPASSGLAALVSCLITDGYRMPGCVAPEDFRFGASYDRNVLEQSGGFREDLLFGEDADLHRRLRSGGMGIELAQDVITEHRYPTTVPRLLADQWIRGQTRGGVGRWRDKIFMAVAAASQAPRGIGRARTLGIVAPIAWPAAALLLALGAGARAAGVLTGRPSDTASAASLAELQFSRWAAGRSAGPLGSEATNTSPARPARPNILRTRRSSCRSGTPGA